MQSTTHFFYQLRWNRYVAMAECSQQMGWRTRTFALPIRDLGQIAYLLPTWGGMRSGVVFLWRRLICPQNSSLRMFWYRDLNSSYFFPRFGALKHEANRTLNISATFIGSRKKFCKRNRMSVCPARKRKASILSVSYRLNRFHRCSRGKNFVPSNFVPKCGPHVLRFPESLVIPKNIPLKGSACFDKSQSLTICLIQYASRNCPWEEIKKEIIPLHMWRMTLTR